MGEEPELWYVPYDGRTVVSAWAVGCAGDEPGEPHLLQYAHAGG